jgi:hypothetical protein
MYKGSEYKLQTAAEQHKKKYALVVLTYCITYHPQSLHMHL